MESLHAAGSDGVGDVPCVNAACGEQKGLLGLVDKAVGKFNFIVV